MISAMTQREVRFFNHTLTHGLQTVETGQVRAALGLAPQEERKLLSRLTQSGRIARIRRGLYLVPQTLPLGGEWGPSDAMALTILMADCGGQYQLCGLNAFNHYGWDEQVPHWRYLYNNRLSGVRQISFISMMFVKVADRRLGGLAPITTPEGLTLNFPSKARALLDAVHDWRRFGTLPRAYRWIGRELATDASLPEALVDATLRFGNQGAIRRIGYILESRHAPDELLRPLEKRLPPSASRIPLDPTRPRRGPISKRWGIADNVH